MNFSLNRQQWDALGQLDPFWAMTGINRFHAWDPVAFFQTGYDQVEEVYREMQRLGYPQHYECVFDFGCGIGRLAPAFCRYFTSYIGVDVADSLIAHAQTLHRDLPQARFATNHASRLDLPDYSVDLVFSFGVLQHIPDQQAILDLLNEFARVLKPGGLIVLNVCHAIRWPYRIQARRRLYHVLKRIGLSDRILYYHFKLYPQSVHAIPQARFVHHLRALPLTILVQRATSPANAPHRLWEYALAKPVAFS